MAHGRHGALSRARRVLPARDPAAQKYLELYWLQPADYGVVGLAVAGWALILSIVWRVIPPIPSGE